MADPLKASLEFHRFDGHPPWPGKAPERMSQNGDDGEEEAPSASVVHRRSSKLTSSSVA